MFEELLGQVQAHVGVRNKRSGATLRYKLKRSNKARSTNKRV